MVSPVTFGIGKSYDDKFLKPAVNGMLNTLKGSKEFAARVTKLVITSSFFTLIQFVKDNINVVHVNKLWNPFKWEDATSPMEAYSGLKKYEGMTAHEFYIEEKPNFRLAVVN